MSDINDNFLATFGRLGNKKMHDHLVLAVTVCDN